MYTNIRIAFLFFILVLPGCYVDKMWQYLHSEYITSVKDFLNKEWKEKITLTRGLSGATLYKVSDENRSYVIKDHSFKSMRRRLQEANAQKIASDVGYGPHVYAYDSKAGIIVMEFLESSENTISLEEKSYKLAQVLKTMHEGPSFDESISFIENAHNLFFKVEQYIPNQYKQEIKNIFTECEKLPIIKKPTHKDLNPNNIIATKDGEYKLIDFENASQDNPFIDLATVIIFNFPNKIEETRFLNNYFGRDISAQEINYLQWFKKLVALNQCFGLLAKISSINLPIESPKVSFYELLDRFKHGTFSLESDENKYIAAMAFLEMAIK